MDQKLQEFYNELSDEVKQYRVDHDRITMNTAFKEVFLSYLAEKEITTLADTTLVEYKKDADNMRLDGYAYSDYFHSLTLLVCKFNSKSEPEMLWKQDIDKFVRKAVKFLRTCDTEFFEDLELTSDGFQAYQAIKHISNDIEIVNVIFITNDIAKNYVPEDMKFRKSPIKFEVYDIEKLYHLILSGDIEY